MHARAIARRLLEEPETSPFEIGPLEPYIGPVEFNVDVKDILDHALFLKEQCTNAGVFEILKKPNTMGPSTVTDTDINRAMLLLACAELEDEVRVTSIADKLKRLMSSIWS